MPFSVLVMDYIIVEVGLAVGIVVVLLAITVVVVVVVVEVFLCVSRQRKKIALSPNMYITSEEGYVCYPCTPYKNCTVGL